MLKDSLKLSACFIKSIIVLLLLTQPTDGRPKPLANADTSKDVISNLESIFKVGPGIMMFNTGPSNLDDDEIICAERSTGKSYCTEVQNYSMTTQLEKIDAELFEQFKAYFQDDLIQTQNVASRMEDETENLKCSSKSRIIYPVGAASKDSKWVLVVQHEQYKQGVLVEECENEGLFCKFNSSISHAISSKCKQHFVYRIMVVLVKGVMKEALVKLPSSCECELCVDKAKL